MSKKKIKSLYSGYDGPVTSEACRESKAVLKVRLKTRKRQLNDFIAVTNNMDIQWDMRNQSVGSLYLEIHRLKRQIKEY